MTRPRPRRSALYVPAVNERAIAKIADLDVDCVIVDLEDAVAPEDKARARAALPGIFTPRTGGRPEMVLRINALSTEWGKDDLKAAIAAGPDAILLPKVDGADDLTEAERTVSDLGAKPDIALWAMVETARCLLALPEIAAFSRRPGSRMACLAAGTNDLVKETGTSMAEERRWLIPWLQQMVLGARAGGLDVLDGVSNDFRDLDAFGRECAQGRAIGFDGKTLIHPAQIAPANLAFTPSAQEIEAARAIVDAFAHAENSGKGVIKLGGRMVERLHLDQAKALIAKTAMLETKP